MGAIHNQADEKTDKETVMGFSKRLIRASGEGSAQGNITA